LCQNGCLSVLSPFGETEKSRVGGNDSRVVYSKKIPWWGRKCETVRCRDTTANSFVAKVRDEVFANSLAVAENTTVYCILASCYIRLTPQCMRIDCLVYRDEFFVNNFSWCQKKKNNELALDYSHHL
jgi:hypothetical protein